MLDFLFYLVYALVKVPNVKKWYNKFWLSLNRKDLARNAYSMLLTFISIELILLLLSLLKLNFKIVVFVSMGSVVLFSILFLFVLVPLRYTHTKINLIEERFKGKIRRWQAVILLLIIFILLIAILYYIMGNG